MSDLTNLPAALLELLHELQRDREQITENYVAERLGVSLDALQHDLERLREAGAITDGMELTADGLVLATAAVRRHALVERLLRDVLRVPWSKVHHEAERWDGVISAEVEARLVDLLGDPGTCPHGNPIPGSVNAPDQRDAIPLKGAPDGPAEVVRITEELETDDDALALLDAAGIVPGRDIEIRGAADDGKIEVAGATADARVPAHVAAMTYVRSR